MGGMGWGGSGGLACIGALIHFNNQEQRGGEGGGLGMHWSPHTFQQSRAERRGAAGV